MGGIESVRMTCGGCAYDCTTNQDVVAESRSYHASAPGFFRRSEAMVAKTQSEQPSGMHLVYVERTGSGGQSSGASTNDGLSSVRSDISSHTRTRTIAMLQTTGLSVPPVKLDDRAVAAFREKLHAAGVDTSVWGVGGAKSVDHLYWETYQQCGCIIVKER